ncbi:MAG: CRISPR-associated CARF protein Csa3 [Candidatus Woesearchaeota archaeon]
MNKKVLIATLYSPEPVLLAANRLGPDRLILLIDKKSNKHQEDSLKVINNSLGRIIDVKPIKVDVYDIVGVAKKVVEVIDMQPRDDRLFVNVTSGRKTQALGLLFGAYARHDRINKIAYNPEEDKNSVVYLPRLSFKLNESQKKILDVVSEVPGGNYAELAEKAGVSKAMFYRATDELKDMDLVLNEDGLKLTDAGEIARL